VTAVLQAALGAFAAFLVCLLLQYDISRGRGPGAFVMVNVLLGVVTLALMVAVVAGIVQRAGWVIPVAVGMLSLQVLGLLLALAAGGGAAGALGVGLSSIVVNRLRTAESRHYLGA
jgi:uncharacterized membrane protein